MAVDTPDGVATGEPDAASVTPAGSDALMDAVEAFMGKIATQLGSSGTR